MNRLALMSRLAIVVLVFSALLSNFILLFQKATAFDPKRLGKDPISLHESRLELLKKALPRHGTVGYISNLTANDIRFDPGFGQYYLTQYALAPLVVDYSSDQPLVVGNLRGSASISTPAVRGIAVLKDFGNGVMLFRQGAK